MRKYRTVLATFLVGLMPAASMLASPAPAAAQAYGDYGYGNSPDEGNSPVATITALNGSAEIVRGDSGAQVAATLNAPLLQGDYIATSPGSTAEVQFDGISMLRLAGDTQVRIVNLAPSSREVQLASGTADLAELQGADGRPQLDTPPLGVRPNTTGDYRATVRGDGTTLVTVRDGSATIETANGSQTLAPGSTLVANGSSLWTQGPVAYDSFDQFNFSRDQAAVTAYNSNPYLSPQLAGYSNLARYGRWQDVPGYGYAWAPYNQSQSNFAPYQNGQWAWEPGYGYTWVDNAPYGYATSHYGSWFNDPGYGGWLWQPPAYGMQNSAASLASAWLPAAVAFFLTGTNGNLGGGLANLFGGGLSNFSGLLGGYPNAGIGWVPLAPGERYQPWYGQNYAYPATALTPVTNVTNVYNYYTNARYYRGTTLVPLSAWCNGNFKRVISLRPRQLKRIALIRGAVPVVPTAANLHYTSRVTLKRPIALSRRFTAPRLAARASAIRHVAFRAQQAKIRSLVAARPKVVAFRPRAVKVVAPVYRPVTHARVRLAATKPIVGRPAPRMKTAVRQPPPAKKATANRAVSATHRAAPLAKRPARRALQNANPIARPAAEPLTRAAAKPLARPARPLQAPAKAIVVPARPALPTTKSVARPAQPAAPAARPVARPAAPPPAPAVRPAPAAKPIARPIPVAKPITRPLPVVKPIAPAPADKPAARPVPVAKPIVPAPLAKPIARPAPVEKPIARPVPAAKPGAHPAASPHSFRT